MQVNRTQAQIDKEQTFDWIIHALHAWDTGIIASTDYTKNTDRHQTT
jgi:hypothetical protein